MRILQIGKSMRLLRLVKLRRIVEDIEDRITSEYFHIIMVVFKLSVFIIWTNHFIACAWWYVGSNGPGHTDVDAERTWTTKFDMQSRAFPYQYFTSLHWSLTQFTPASMEIVPRNVNERIFSVFVLFFAMIAFSSFVSSITAAMTQLRNLSNPVAKHFVILRRYLHARSVSSDLVGRITRCVNHGIRETKEIIPESDVDLFKFLSTPLRMELMFNVHCPVLASHPFFRRYAAEDPIAMQNVCLKSVKRLNLSTGDVLFSEACSGGQMFFVTRGKLRYTCQSHLNIASTHYEATKEATKEAMTLDAEPSVGAKKTLPHSHLCLPRGDHALDEREWFCETCLWCPWTYRGLMTVLGHSEVLAIDAVDFARVSTQHHLVGKPSRAYGEAFIKRLNEESHHGSVSDVWPFDFTVLDRMVQSAFGD